MIQHVGVTPVVKMPGLREDLFKLHFQPISNRFGCFFLHDLDLTNGHLPEVEQTDSEGLLKSMGITSARQRRERTPVPDLLPSDGSVTWKELRQLLNMGSERAKVREWTWDPLWSTYSIAAALFCRFTHDYWIIFTEIVFRPLEGPPATLEEAMQLWTLGSAKQRITRDFNIYLRPSVDGLENNVPPKSQTQTFKSKRKYFFPEPNTKPVSRSHWENFYDPRTGYVAAYHRAIEVSRDGGEAMRNALDGIFENLQLLPFNPGRPSDVKQLWMLVDDDVLFLFNSMYIQLEDRIIRFRGGTGKETRRRGKQKLRSKKDVALILRGKELLLHPKKTRAMQKYIATNSKEVMRGRRSRRGQRKNFREPPTTQPAGDREPQGAKGKSRDLRKPVGQKGRADGLGHGNHRERGCAEELPPIAFLEGEEGGVEGEMEEDEEEEFHLDLELDDEDYADDEDYTDDESSVDEDR